MTDDLTRRRRSQTIVAVVALLVGSAGGYLYARSKLDAETVAAVHFQVSLSAQQKIQILSALRQGKTEDASRLAQNYLKSDLTMLELYLPSAAPDRIAHFEEAIRDARAAIK